MQSPREEHQLWNELANTLIWGNLKCTLWPIKKHTQLNKRFIMHWNSRPLQMFPRPVLLFFLSLFPFCSIFFSIFLRYSFLEDQCAPPILKGRLQTRNKAYVNETGRNPNHFQDNSPSFHPCGTKKYKTLLTESAWEQFHISHGVGRMVYFNWKEKRHKGSFS